MQQLPSPADLILVTYMPTPKDMEIARVLGWYRIPLRTAPKVIAVDYLAFYQPASFGEHKWRVEYIAPVRGHELTSRAELLREELDHPRAKEEYFKIQIGPLIRLQSPIHTERWKRITFLYTTGEYLLAARTVNDLVVESDQRRVLWRALRERAKTSRQKVIPEMDIPEEVLENLLGISDLNEPYET